MNNGIDLCFVGEDSLLENNIFVGNGGDVIDLSWEELSISKNTVINCEDKGVGVGEMSNLKLLYYI
jgi:hypothetical protein